MKRTGAQIIWESLLREGVTTVFGYPGGAILPAYDALLGVSHASHVLVRHEQGATHMADGFARAGGRRGRRDRDVRTRRYQHGDRYRDRHAGFVARCVCITGQVGSRSHRLRCVPGDRHHRRDAADHQTQLPGDARSRTIARTIHEAFYVAKSGTAGTGADRHHEGRTAGVDASSSGTTRDVQLPGYRPDRRASA